jgi:hypothetical protein
MDEIISDEPTNLILEAQQVSKEIVLGEIISEDSGNSAYKR